MFSFGKKSRGCFHSIVSTFSYFPRSREEQMFDFRFAKKSNLNQRQGGLLEQTLTFRGLRKHLLESSSDRNLKVCIKLTEYKQ